MIENILPSTKSKLKILKGIYKNPNINITSLIDKTKTSPTRATKYIDILVKYKIIEEKRSYGKNNSYMRLLKPNFSSNMGKLFYMLVEIDKKYKLLDKYEKLKPTINQLNDLLKDNNICCLIYGSFARFSVNKESDIDILMIGKLNEEKQKRISEIFVSVEREYSIQIESLDDFIKNANNPFHQTILNNHVIIFNEKMFIDILSKIK